MYRIDNATAITPLPAPTAPGPNVDHYFTKGNPGAAIPATVLDDEWANMVQEELCNILNAFGIAPDKSKRNQLATLLSTSGLSGRIRLQADTIFYVRADGNDAHNGLANTALGAWLTIQHAINVLQNLYDNNGFAMTLDVGAGSFAGCGFTGLVGTGQTYPLTINGVGPTTIITSAIGGGGPNLLLTNMKFVCPADNAVISGGSGSVSLGVGIEFGACGLAHIYANTGTIFVNASYAISGGGTSHYQEFNIGRIIVNGGVVITLSNTPAFPNGFVDLNSQSNLIMAGNGGAPVFAGTGATGSRFTIDNLSLAFTGGGGANYFPGNIAGTNGGHGAIYN